MVSLRWSSSSSWSSTTDCCPESDIPCDCTEILQQNMFGYSSSSMFDETIELFGQPIPQDNIFAILFLVVLQIIIYFVYCFCFVHCCISCSKLFRSLETNQSAQNPISESAQISIQFPLPQVPNIETVIDEPPPTYASLAKISQLPLSTIKE